MTGWDSIAMETTPVAGAMCLVSSPDPRVVFEWQDMVAYRGGGTYTPRDPGSSAQGVEEEEDEGEDDDDDEEDDE